MLFNYRAQVLVLKKLLSFFIFVINIFGLWPFRIFPSNGRIKYCYLKALYSVLMLCCGSLTYLIIGAYVFGIRKNHFNSFTLKLVTSIHGYSILIIFVFVYIGPHLNSRKIEITYSKCKEIFDVINGSFCFKRTSILLYLLDIVMKTVVYDIIMAVLSLQIFSRSSNTMSITIFLLLLLPPIAARLYMNLFYGALLVLDFYFKKLNESLNDIITKAQINWMEKNSELSDRIDSVSIMYFRLTDATKSINGIFSFNITLGHTLTVIALIIQSLLIFVGIMENIFGLIFMPLAFYDIFSTAVAADKVEREVRNCFLFFPVIILASVCMSSRHIGQQSYYIK